MIEKISFEDFKNLIIDFLNEHNILESFEENLIKYKNSSLDKYICNFYIEHSPIDYFIISSFYWKNTKESVDFWEKINEKYFAFFSK